MKRTRKGLLVLVAVSANAFAQAQEAGGEIERIERAFIDAQDVEVINRIADVPPDVVEQFGAIARWNRMAEWGERWNSGDVAGPRGEAVSQHVFSGVSDSVAVIVYREGGEAGPYSILLIAERGVAGVCRYSLGDLIPDSLEYLQEAIRGTGMYWDKVCRYVPGD